MRYLEMAKELTEELNNGGVLLASRIFPTISFRELEICPKIKEGIAFILSEDNQIMGHMVLVEPTHNLFLSKNNEAEIVIGELCISSDYKGEGLEALLIEIAINYSSKLQRPLVVHKETLGNNFSSRFFESRGFEFEPVIYHETIFVLGNNYVYNLKNIDEVCYNFLDKSKFPREKDKLDKKDLVEVIELISRVKSIANNINYLPTWVKNMKVNWAINEGNNLELPEVPSLKNVNTLKGLKEALLHYLGEIRNFELFITSLNIEENGESSLLEAEPFTKKLLEILERDFKQVQ